MLAWLAGLATGAAWLLPDPNARIAAALLLAPLLVDFALKPRALPLIRVRAAARRTSVGAPFVERVELHAEGTRAVRECVLHEPRTMAAERAALVERLRPGETLSVELHCRSLQRSHVVERAFVLRSAWPLGFCRIQSTVVVRADLITEPARVPLRAELLAAVAEREPAPLERSQLPGAEFHSLREHLTGEDARHVHALRSATAGRLVTRVTQGRLPEEVGIVLDLRRPPGRPLHLGQRRFEWSLGACAELMAQMRARAAALRIVVLGSRTVRVRVAGPQQELELLTFLAEAQPSPHRPLDEPAVQELRRHEHCFWIPAGGLLLREEVASLPGAVTLIGGELE